MESKAFEPQHLALIVWSFAVLQIKPVKLLEVIEGNVLAQLNSLSTQNCANVLWGFAKLNYKPLTLLGPLSARMLEPTLLQAMKPVEVADAAFALAVVGTAQAQGELMQALACRAEHETMLSKFTSRQLVLMTWAFARMKLRPGRPAALECTPRAHSPETCPKVARRSLVLLRLLLLRAQTQLSDWIAEIQEAHARQPLLAADQKNLEVALERFGEDAEWLHPPKEEEEEEAAEDGAAA